MHTKEAHRSSSSRFVKNKIKRFFEMPAESYYVQNTTKMTLWEFIIVVKKSAGRLCFRIREREFHAELRRLFAVMHFYFMFIISGRLTETFSELIS